MKHSPKLRYQIAGCLLILASCSVLSKSQKSAVEEFAGSASSYSELPKQLLSSCNECIYKFKQLAAVQFRDSSLMLQSLESVGAAYFSTSEESNNLKTSFQLIEKYSKALLEFVNVDISKVFKENTSTLGVVIDTLIKTSTSNKINTIPTGFGDLGAKLIQFIGQRRISRKQLKQAREFIRKGDSLVANVSFVLNEVILDMYLRKELIKDRQQLEGIYRTFLRLVDVTERSPYQYYTTLNPKYIEIKDCLDANILLMQEVAKATDKFRKAHKAMLDKLNKNDDPNPFKTISSFTKEVSEIFLLMDRYSKKL